MSERDMPAGQTPTSDHFEVESENIGDPNAALAAASAAEPSAPIAAPSQTPAPFTNQQLLRDPVALRDGLTPVQARGNAAARISGEHLARLLYDQGAVEQHRAPYDIHYGPNIAVGSREHGKKQE